MSELNLTLTPDDPVESVEITSEQGRQLLFSFTGENTGLVKPVLDRRTLPILLSLKSNRIERRGRANWQFRRLGDPEPHTSRVPPTPSTSTPPIASAELEVDVAYLLIQAKADRNEQVALTRSAGGSLRVEGVVDTLARGFLISCASPAVDSVTARLNT